MYANIINRRFEKEQDYILNRIKSLNDFQRIYKLAEFKNVMPSILNGCVNNYKSIQKMDLAPYERALLINLVEYYASKHVEICVDRVDQYRNQLEGIFIGKKLTFKNMIYEAITQDYFNSKMFLKSQYLIKEYEDAADKVYNLDIENDFDELIGFYIEHLLDDVVKANTDVPVKNKIAMYNSMITATCNNLRVILRKAKLYSCLEALDNSVDRVIAKQKELVR